MQVSDMRFDRKFQFSCRFGDSPPRIGGNSVGLSDPYGPGLALYFLDSNPSLLEDLLKDLSSRLISPAPFVGWVLFVEDAEGVRVSKLPVPLVSHQISDSLS